MPTRAAAVVCLAVLASACDADGTSSPASTTDAVSDAVGGAGDAASETETSVADLCPHLGVWLLQTISCGSIDITAEWVLHVPETKMKLASPGARVRSMKVWHEAPSCTEIHEGTLTPDGDAWQLQTGGVTGCEPPGCKFAEVDEPCALGDQAGVGTATIERHGDHHTEMTMALTSSQGLCAKYGLAPETTTWKRSMDYTIR